VVATGVGVVRAETYEGGDVVAAVAVWVSRSVGGAEVVTAGVRRGASSVGS